MDFFYNIYDELGSVAMVINDRGRVMESNQYKAFGVKDYAFKERPQATGYIGKEKDAESNMGDHGVRKYDSDLGRFLCPDAMWDSQLSFSPYHYCYNNPIKLIDENGLLPGDPFESEAQAAHDFGKNYGYLSFAIDAEISTSIYKFEDKGKTQYTYAIPNTFARTGANSSISKIEKEGYEKTAIAHTHGLGPRDDDYEKKPKPDDFSIKDKKTNINSYLITPGGYLKLYVLGGGSIGLTNDMPKDNGNNSSYFWKMVDSNKDKRPLPIIGNVNGGMNLIEDAKTQIDRSK